MQDVLYLIKKFPYLNKINEGIVRYEGYIKSLEKDN